MASSTMQTCHLPKETRLAPRKPVAYSQRKMPANRVSNPRRDCWPQLPRKLHHPPGGAPKAPRVRGSRSLLAAAAGQENSIPQRLVETKPWNFFSFLEPLQQTMVFLFKDINMKQITSRIIIPSPSSNHYPTVIEDVDAPTTKIHQ